MEQGFQGVDTLNIIVTTIILLSIGGLLIYFLFQYQRKRFLHQREVLELRESFSKSLLQSKLEIQEQTLGHIARELHDNISPLISVIQLNLGAPKLKKIQEITLELAEIKANTNQLMTELKSLSLTLNTDHIMNSGFVEGLWNEMDRLERTGVFKTTRTVMGEKFRFRPEHEIILFRMCQEVLNNIVKHSKAENIVVILDFGNNRLVVSISDDGVGFNPALVYEGAKEKSSTGLINIKSRALLIKANVQLESEPGKGSKTVITLSN